MVSISTALDLLHGQLDGRVMKDRAVWREVWEAAHDVLVTEEHELIVHLGEPATEADVAALKNACLQTCGFVPEDLLGLYRRHDGIWTEFCAPGGEPSKLKPPRDGALVSAGRLVEVLAEVRELLPDAKKSDRPLPIFPIDHVRWHASLTPRSIAYFSLEMEQATLAKDLGSWVQSWIAHGFADWSYDLPNELEDEFD